MMSFSEVRPEVLIQRRSLLPAEESLIALIVVPGWVASALRMLLSVTAKSSTVTVALAILSSSHPSCRCKRKGVVLASELDFENEALLGFLERRGLDRSELRWSLAETAADK